MAVTQQQHAPDPTALLSALQRSQQRNRELEHYLKWEERLFSNSHLSATHKLTLIATRRAVPCCEVKPMMNRAGLV